MLIGIAIVPGIFLFVVILLNGLRLLFPGLHNVPTNPLEALAGNSAEEAALFGLLAIVAGGIREELQRAFLLHRFEQHLGGAKVGVVVLSAAFGLGHYVQGWDAVITTAALGRVLGRALSGSSQQRGAGGEPCRIQFARNPESGAGSPLAVRADHKPRRSSPTAGLWWL